VVQQSLLPERLWRQTLQPEKALFQHESRNIALLRTQLMALFKSPGKLKALKKNGSASLHLRNWILDELRTIFLDIDSNQNPGEKPVRKVSRRYRIFTRAIDMIEDNLTEHLSVKQICDQIGASTRTLQFCFNEILGATPFQYIAARKLHAIQQGILTMNDPAMTISHLAQNYGFHHAGRFGAQYKRLFGELPRSTLKRKR
jgi:AraC family ethanolamine operon transcriptional activator